MVTMQKGRHIMVVQCCVCKKIRKNDAWIMAAPTTHREAVTSHGYCPNCAKDAFREIKEYHQHNFRDFGPAKAINS